MAGPPLYQSKRFRTIALATVLGLLVYYFAKSRTISWSPHMPHFGTTKAERIKVPLEAHIMSKCPDTEACINQMLVPTLKEVGNLVDFRFSFVGEVDPETFIPSCKHGVEECEANRWILCAQDIYANATAQTFEFTKLIVDDYVNNPDVHKYEERARQTGLDPIKILRCIAPDRKGQKLLADSMLRTSAASVTKSCTVRLQNTIYCVHDDGEWKSCPYGSKPEILVQKIRDLAAQAKN